MEVELFVPGRLCLIGEHSDWAATFRATDPTLERGHCLVTATDQGLHAAAVAHPDRFVIETVLEGGGRQGPLAVPAHEEALDAVARRGGFFSYAAGTAAEVLARHRVGGLQLQVFRADLPAGKGLSSSAAACVLVARAYGQVYGLALSPEDEMVLAYAGERRAGSGCGRMDQVCAFGRRTVALTFDGDDMEVTPLVPSAPVPLLVIDLRRGKDTRRILADLRACFPDAPGRVAARVRDALGPRNAALAAAGRAAVLGGDACGLGALMAEAQAVFDRLVAPACPELRAPRLHAVLAHPAVRTLAWGGKGVGSQGDGCAQVVARGFEERAALAARLRAVLDVACFPVTLSQEIG